MRSLPFGLGIVVCLVVLVGCEKESAQPEPLGQEPKQQVQPEPVMQAEPDSRRETPDTCYTAFRFAWMLGDYNKAFELLTPRAQREVAGNVLGYIAMVETHARGNPKNPYDFTNDGSTPENKARAELLSQVMKKRGYESATDLYRACKVVSDDKLSHEELQERYRNTLVQLTRELGTLDVFVQDTIAVVRGERPYVTNREALDVLRIGYGPLIEVSIEDDQARGWQFVGKHRGEVSVDFVHNESGWLIDQAIPGGHYLFRGGLSRDEKGSIQPR